MSWEQVNPLRTYRERHLRDHHKNRDWTDLPGYVSMRERPLWMKQSDWRSLTGQEYCHSYTVKGGKTNFLINKFWPLFMGKHKQANKAAYHRIFGEDAPDQS